MMNKKIVSSGSKNGEPVKNVYSFGAGKGEGDGTMKNLLGGKGAGLHEMTNSGVTVPAGFTITTDVCDRYYKGGRVMPAELYDEVEANINKLEETMGMKLGDPKNPLLVSVRSGARDSMPGMMDTVLNLGINDVVVEGLITKTNNPRFAWDSYRRFIQMFSDVAMDVPKHLFEHALTEAKNKLADQTGRSHKEMKDTDLSADDLKELVSTFKAIYKKEKGEDFPQDPRKQMWAAVAAVFGSWNNDRAIFYRKQNNITGLLGTAVNVQAMVFGNMGSNSATGVCFSRDPASGENKFYGEFLINAQGEDVVAGIRTPQKISLESSLKWANDHEISESDRKAKYPSLEEEMPEVYQQLLAYKNMLEKHNHDMQDMEFTIQEGKLYMLQTRNGKRTGFAAIKVAADMVKEGLITDKEAVMRVSPGQLDEVLRPVFDQKDKAVAKAEGRIIAKGLNAGPGAATGRVYFSALEAEEAKLRGEKVILVRHETTPEDIKGMDASEGILTMTGGATSHAAVVARQMGKVCVVGCSAIHVDYAMKTMTVGNVVIRQGDYISIDGFTGEVIVGKVNTTPSEVLQVLLDNTLAPEKSELFQAYKSLMDWTDKYKKLGIRANADQPDQARNARLFGAEGIGLDRSEHMFFGGERIKAVREMILASDAASRKKALDKMLTMQEEDFAGIFEAMEGLPVTIRLLDPPLHEFLPHRDVKKPEKYDKDVAELAEEMGLTFEVVDARIKSLHEFNPMLGHRGCRLGITFPEVYDMQVRAIILAAIEMKKKGIDVVPEIMIPLIGDVKELTILKENAIKVIAQELNEANMEIKYKIGTMIEVPRAALTADEIAPHADFLSFGTNDLTQMTAGFSRDDAGSFLPEYIEKGIYPFEPFQTLDRKGVGKLMKIAIDLARSTNPHIKLGVCGEHGGDPNSIEFFNRIGLTYVSASPYRIPIARLSAAQAAIDEASRN